MKLEHSDDLYRGQTARRVFNEEDRQEFVRRVVKHIPTEDLSHPVLIAFLVENVLERLGYWEHHTSLINQAIQDEIKKRVLAEQTRNEDDFDEVYELAREHYDGAFRELVDK
ncbi:hypothetical protein FAJ34_10675 [Streptococcus suis]|uniref:Uncharacterized protein n=1 Tax=Streptococcus suis TaxID=1307 RepID=A0A4T2H1D9_STRSU|nr:hypothetical protein [Streptococcus suis]MCI7344657.1 hypothetical protein [Fusobacterium necrophorum]TII05034.1 hypothetical protein FAJ34_10675 [Streptococcus suis]